MREDNDVAQWQDWIGFASGTFQRLTPYILPDSNPNEQMPLDVKPANGLGPTPDNKLADYFPRSSAGRLGTIIQVVATIGVDIERTGVPQRNFLIDNDFFDAI